jgi:TRAP-type C4-dicarboxylate transport system substrate-binding protein
MPAQRSRGRIPGDADGSTRRRRGTWKTAPALAAGIAFALPAAAEQRACRIGPSTPPVHVWNEEVAALGETLKERLDGRFGLAVFPSDVFGDEAAMLQSCRPVRSTWRG